jgi:hypothetical protein
VRDTRLSEGRNNQGSTNKKGVRGTELSQMTITKEVMLKSPEPGGHSAQQMTARIQFVLTNQCQKHTISHKYVQESS